MNLVEVEVNVLLIISFALMCMCLIAAISSSGKEKVAKDAYNLGYERGMQAEKENVEKIIRDFAECNDDCKTNFYYGQGCNACFWNTIIEKVKGDAE